jgi:hypothetical protein
MKKYKDVKKFVVKRNKWLRGNTDDSTLLDSRGRMCCLGFYSRACGLPKKMIADESAPANAVNNNNLFMEM